MRGNTTRTVVCIVGGGFSATALCLEFAWRRPDLAPVVVERASAGRGIAYRTGYRTHLLNVPAGRMSALAGDPDHFVRWLRIREPGADANTFARRADFGDYLAEMIGASGARVVEGEAVHIEGMREGFRVVLNDGRRIETGVCILALGSLPPAIPAPFAPWRNDERMRWDPWAPDALPSLPDGPVLLLGTGLTAVDVALALDEAGHAGPVHALSRHGLLPLAHRRSLPLPLSERRRELRSRAVHPFVGTSPGPDGTVSGKFERPTIRGLLARLREDAGLDGDWRRAVDELRPRTRALWRAMPEAERRRFLRHTRAYWEVHRHRMAPEAAARISRLIGEGYLTVSAGRVLGVEELGERALRIRWRRRGDGEESLRAASVVVCTGPAPRAGDSGDRLVDALLGSGLATLDGLGLGIATDGDGRLLDAAGAPSGPFAIGSLRIPAEWESTAVPELRSQAASLVERLARAVPAQPGRDAGRRRRRR